MEASSEDNQITLTAQERKRLADYLDVLIEMHLNYKRNQKGNNNEDNEEINVLLSF